MLIKGVEGIAGPGKLCKALNITKKDNGQLFGKRINLLNDGYVPKIKRSQRIGITKDAHLK